MHLCDAEPLHPKRRLWKAFRRREFFFDDDFARLLQHLHEQALADDQPAELLLNGDIFDFDSIMQLPRQPEGEVNWLAKLRGLPSEEWMSAWKMELIIEDHLKWFQALTLFLSRGHRAIFVVGNHDVEIHWPRVQQRIREQVGYSEPQLVFCPWFYLSGNDTFVTHGNQFDPYCSVQNPIDPLIAVGRQPRVRIPFGDQAQRYMLNGMGYFNPHATANYIMSAWQYVRFFFKYMIRDQPFMLWTWLWSASVTLVLTLRDFLLPPMQDPMMVEEKVQAIAERSQVTPSQVRQLSALIEPPALTNPLMVLRELWLDRALLMIGLLFVAWEIVLAINFLWPIGVFWVMVPLILLSPAYWLYARAVHSEVFSKPLLSPQCATWLHQITGVSRCIVGHTHVPGRDQIGPIALWNSGCWSPAFSEPECINRVTVPTFVWLKPNDDGPRECNLWTWPPNATQPGVFALEPTRRRPSSSIEAIASALGKRSDKTTVHPDT